MVRSGTEYLRFKNVGKFYRSYKALDQFSMDIKPGEKVALLGVNGAGKSTLVSLATGLRKEDEGELTLFGGSPRDASRRTDLGYLPQDIQFPGFLKVDEVIRTAAAHFSNPFMDIIPLLDLGVLLDKKIGALSGGQHRRVALAVSLIGGPKLALLDEPTGGMDISMRNQTFEVLRDYFAKEDRSVLFSTHHMDEVEKLADRVLVIHKGKLVTQGSVSEIKETYGLRELRFRSTMKGLQLKSAKHILRENDSFRAIGTDSDLMVKELLQVNPDAKNISIKEPCLEEIFVTLTRAAL